MNDKLLISSNMKFIPERVWRDKYGKNAPKAFRVLARSVGSLWVRKTFYHISTL